MGTHYTNIGGTDYQIKSGIANIGGTGYQINKGYTNIDGTTKEISFKTYDTSIGIRWQSNNATGTMAGETYTAAFRYDDQTYYYTDGTDVFGNGVIYNLSIPADSSDLSITYVNSNGVFTKIYRNNLLTGTQSLQLSTYQDMKLDLGANFTGIVTSSDASTGGLVIYIEYNT